MPYVIAALYASLAVEVATVAAIGVRVLSPERPVSHGKTYSGAWARASYRHRMAVETLKEFPTP